jgi:glutamate synthase domain-containing protein 3
MESTKIAFMNSGFIEIYSGPQPANANTALAGNVLLVTLTFAATAFNPPVSGSATANAISSGTAINAGLATFARIYQTNGSTVVMDVTVGEAGQGAYITLADTSLQAGGLVSISSFTDSCPE